MNSNVLLILTVIRTNVTFPFKIIPIMKLNSSHPKSAITAIRSSGEEYLKMKINIIHLDKCGKVAKEYANEHQIGIKDLIFFN